MSDVTAGSEPARSSRDREMAEALRALARKLKQPEPRFELEQLAEEYERLSSFAQSVSADQPG
jgi:uncharacterized protein (DUF3084 family)